MLKSRLVRLFAFLALTEGVMPTKEQVRYWMAQRLKERQPPPSPEKVHEQLGWKLIPKARS